MFLYFFIPVIIYLNTKGMRLECVRKIKLYLKIKIVFNFVFYEIYTSYLKVIFCFENGAN